MLGMIEEEYKKKVETIETGLKETQKKHNNAQYLYDRSENENKKLKKENEELQENIKKLQSVIDNFGDREKLTHEFTEAVKGAKDIYDMKYQHHVNETSEWIRKFRAELEGRERDRVEWFKKYHIQILQYINLTQLHLKQARSNAHTYENFVNYIEGGLKQLLHLSSNLPFTIIESGQPREHNQHPVPPQQHEHSQQDPSHQAHEHSQQEPSHQAHEHNQQDPSHQAHPPDQQGQQHDPQHQHEPQHQHGHSQQHEPQHQHGHSQQHEHDQQNDGGEQILVDQINVWKPFQKNA